MEGALAAAAAARARKKEKEISAAAVKTEEERVAKQEKADPTIEKEAEWLDQEKKARIEAGFAQVEEVRKHKFEKDPLQEQEADWLDKEKKERIAAGLAQFEEERTQRQNVSTDKEGDWLDQEKKERIEAAAAKAEEERLAKLHAESEEAHKWKKPKNVGLGKGEKPSYLNFQPSRQYQAPSMTRVGEISQDRVVTPRENAHYKRPEVKEASNDPARQAAGTASSNKGVAEQPIDGVTQADLKAHQGGSDQPTGPYTPHQTKTPATTAEPTPNTTTHTTEVINNGVKTTTTSTTYTVKKEAVPVESSPPPPGCCVIL